MALAVESRAYPSVAYSYMRGCCCYRLHRFYDLIYEIFFESEVFSLTETLFVGIDVSKLSNTVRCMDFFGDSLFLKDFPNDRFGAEDIRDSIKNVILALRFHFCCYRNGVYFCLCRTVSFFPSE